MVVVCRAYIILGVGQQLQHQDFQRRVEGKQTAFFLGGGGGRGFSIHVPVIILCKK